MDISNIYQHYYSKANIYSIDPKFIIDFSINNFQGFCIYDNTQFGVMLNKNDIKYVDIDYLYFEVAILLINRLNKEITKYNLLA